MLKFRNTEVVTKNFKPKKSTTLIVNDQHGIPNGLCACRRFGLVNRPIRKYGKDFRRGCKGIKISKKLVHLGIGGHNDRLAKLFIGDKRC